MTKFSKINDKLVLPECDDGESILRLFDEENPDKILFNLINEETIKLGGSPIRIYLYHQSENQVDDVYMEERNKTISYTPILAYGHYDPRPIEQNLSQFGLELSNDQLFVFNKTYIERKIGRDLIPGDIVQPVFQNIKFEIFEVQESSFEAYGIYHLSCYAKVLRDTEDTHRQQVNVSEKINSRIDPIDPYEGITR